MTDDLRLYLLTLVTADHSSIHYCKTLAHSLDEAVAQCAAHYGPFELNAHGTVRIDRERCLLGGGRFISSSNDALLTLDQLTAISS